MEVKFPNYIGTIFKFNAEKSTWDFLCKADGIIDLPDGKFGLSLKRQKADNLEWVKDIPSNVFQYLNLSYQDITDELLFNFKHFNNLEVLSINNNPITSKGLSSILHNTKIKRLQISNTLLEEKDISLIKNLNELTSLEMRFDKDFTGW